MVIHATQKNIQMTPANNVLLKNCAATTISIERSFSMIGSIFRKKIHFNEFNIFIAFYNNCRNISTTNDYIFLDGKYKCFVIIKLNTK